MVPLTDEFFDGLRFIGDAQTDGMVESLIQSGQLASVNEILRKVVYNKDVIPAELPEELKQWYIETAILPDWVDPARIQRARDFFTEHGLVISLILSTASLTDCFAGKKGVKVLVKTGILQNKTYIRLTETAQFVFNIMEKDGLEPTGKGIRSIQKVRLMHTATRRLIVDDKIDPWNLEELGLPVCQEDLLGTLMSFTTLVFDCMDKLQLTYTPEAAEDYFYIWRVIAEMLGIRPDLIPHNVSEAKQMMQFISSRQFGPSDEGRIMTKALMDMFERVIPSHIAEGTLHEFMRFLVGEEISDWMDIHRKQTSFMSQIIGSRLFESMEHFLISVAIVNKISIDLIVNGLHFERQGEPLFDIPTHLRDAWSIYDDSMDEAAASKEENN
jgi:hypothetical protein